MTTLREINGEALSVPGLRFWGGKRNTGEPRIVAQNEHGAVELWQMNVPESMASMGPLGGVEIHSPRMLHDWDPEPAFTDCDILGGPCWCDGSSLAFSEQFWPLIRARDSAGVLRLLADWHASNFTPDVASGEGQ